MKTKDLIRLLQEIDPDGECDVCISGEELHNTDILYVDRVECFKDGYAETFVRDPQLGDVVGAYIGTGPDKVRLHTLALRDFMIFFDQPTLPVLVKCGNPQSQRRIEEFVAMWRDETRELRKELYDESRAH